MQSYSDFVTTVLENAFPEDVAPNLSVALQNRLLSGLIEVQDYVPQLQLRNLTITHHKDSFYKQGMTVLNKPSGKVKGLFVFSSKRLNDAVFYEPCSLEDMRRLVQQAARDATYPDAFQEALGYFSASVTTDKTYRAERGVFCLDGKEILIFPHLESNERVAVEWRGIKREYCTDDLVDFGVYYQEVLDLMVLHQKKEAALRDDRSTSDWQALTLNYRDQLAKLQIRAKDDNSLEPPLDDIGGLMRSPMPVIPPLRSVGADFSLDGPYFARFWLYCEDNGLWYNFGALVIDNSVEVANWGDGEGGGKPEATVKTLRLDAFYTQGDDEKFYQIAPDDPGSGIVAGIIGAGVEDDCQGFVVDYACMNLDLLKPDTEDYYRVTLVLADGVPVVNIEAAPAECDVIADEDCSKEFRDCLTGDVIQVRISDGQFVINSGASNQPISKLVMKDKTTGKTVYVRVKDGQLIIQGAA